MDETTTKRYASRFNALAGSRGIGHLRAVAHKGGQLRVSHNDSYVADVDPAGALKVLERLPRTGMSLLSLAMTDGLVRALFAAYKQGRKEGYDEGHEAGMVSAREIGDLNG